MKNENDKTMGKERKRMKKEKCVERRTEKRPREERHIKTVRHFNLFCLESGSAYHQLLSLCTSSSTSINTLLPTYIYSWQTHIQPKQIQPHCHKSDNTHLNHNKSTSLCLSLSVCPFYLSISISLPLLLLSFSSRRLKSQYLRICCSS